MGRWQLCNDLWTLKKDHEVRLSWFCLGKLQPVAGASHSSAEVTGCHCHYLTKGVRLRQEVHTGAWKENLKRFTRWSTFSRGCSGKALADRYKQGMLEAASPFEETTHEGCVRSRMRAPSALFLHAGCITNPCYETPCQAASLSTVWGIVSCSMVYFACHK